MPGLEFGQIAQRFLGDRVGAGLGSSGFRGEIESALRRGMELLIYCGVPLLEASDGLEAVYEELLELEGAILEAVQFAVIQAGLAVGAFLRTEHVETITDEDRLPHYKLFAMRWRVEG